MSRYLRSVFVAAAVLVVAGLPALYSARRTVASRNFRAVEDGVLYRSGQMTLDGLGRVCREYGIRTVVSFRDTERDGEPEGEPPPDSAEEAFCRANGVHFVRVTQRKWLRPDGSVPAERGVNEFLAVMDRRDQLKPILVHCFAGVHRTGAHVAIYRMEYQRWPTAAAVGEMRTIGVGKGEFRPDLLAYLDGYTPRWARVGGVVGDTDPGR